MIIKKLVAIIGAILFWTSSPFLAHEKHSLTVLVLDHNRKPMPKNWVNLAKHSTYLYPFIDTNRDWHPKITDNNGIIYFSDIEKYEYVLTVYYPDELQEDDKQRTASFIFSTDFQGKTYNYAEVVMIPFNPRINFSIKNPAK